MLSHPGKPEQLNLFDDLQRARAEEAEQPERIDRMLQFFAYAHLPPELQAVSQRFCTLAYEMVEHLPVNPERTVCLRKLLEAKDAAVRTLLYKG